MKAESRRTGVAGPDQRAAKQMSPGHCTNQIHLGLCPGVTFLHSFPFYIACPKLASPAGDTFACGPLEFDFRGKNCVGKGA